MTQDTSGKSPDPIPGWKEMLSRRRALLLVVAIVLLVIALAGGATYWAMAIAFLAIAAAAAFIPSAPAIGGAEPVGVADTQRDAHIIAFADALGDPCLLLNRRGIIVHRNPASAREFPGARLGDPVAFSFRTPAVLTAIDAAMQTDVPQTVELHLTVPNEIWYKVVISPLRTNGPGSDPSLMIVTLQNLTEQKRVEAMRSDFIANASHELRTPLTSLIGFIDTLLGPASKDQAARERFLGIMRAQAQRMSKLIDDLLSLSRIEMRQHVLPRGTVDLGLLLQEVSEGLESLSQDAGVEVNVTVPEEKATVTGERDELYEVFENLLENAISYGGDGGKVDIALAPATGRPGYDYLVTVTDYGQGVEAQHVPRLTERFYRADSEAKKKKGTGLGLAIVKHIVQRHRGILTIRSQKGEGTRVEVLLPR